MSRLTRLSLLALCSLTLSACAASNVTIQYSPQTTAEVKGAARVNPFKYMRGNDVDENELQCSGCVGGIHLTETVSDYATNAARREFRQSGVSFKDARCSIDGEINWWGYSIAPFSDQTFKSDMRYILTDAGGKVLYDNNFKVEFDAANIPNPTLWINNLNKALANNFDKLLNDHSFTSALERNCK